MADPSVEELERRIWMVMGRGSNPDGDPRVFPALLLPNVASGNPVHEATVVAISTEGIYVNRNRVTSVVDGFIRPSSDGTDDDLINSELFAAFDQLQTTLQVLETTTWNQNVGAFGRFSVRRWTVVVAADRRSTYQTVTDVMLAASAAGFSQFSLAVMETGEDTPPVSGNGPNVDSIAVLPVSNLPTAVNCDRDLVDDDANELRSYLAHLARQQCLAQIHLPHIELLITSEGFSISEISGNEVFGASGFARPDPACTDQAGDNVVTLCVQAEPNTPEELSEQLDFQALNDRLVHIRTYDRWRDYWAYGLLYVSAEPDVPWDAVVRVLDVINNPQTGGAPPEGEGALGFPNHLHELREGPLFRWTLCLPERCGFWGDSVLLSAPPP